MSRYFYSALGHCVRGLDDSFVCLRYQRGRWVVVEDGQQYDADDYRLWSAVDVPRCLRCG